LFFFIFLKKGGSNFLKTGYLFFIQPIKMSVVKNLLSYTKSQKNKSERRRFYIYFFFAEILTFGIGRQIFDNQNFGWLDGK
jgi:hypothetical protein